MSNKKDKNENLNEQNELDPADFNSQEVESISGESEADDVGANPVYEEVIQPAESDSETEEELSPDDLLEDVRRSLISEMAEKEQEEESKWWKRIGSSSRRKKKADVLSVETINVPVEPSDVEAEKQEGNQDQFVEQLDELIDILEDETREDAAVEGMVAAPMEEIILDKEEKAPEAIGLNELKKRAFSARTTPDEEEKSLSEVRSVALSDGEEVFVEVEAATEDPLRDRWKAFENTLKPYRRYFYFVFVFVSLVMVLLVSASMYRLYQQSLPPPPTEVPSLLPYPVTVNLPGGLRFNLGKGKLQEGRWNPRGPEWLVGTEICRWIAIPYSRQMEAVVLTLSKDDEIELVMSNNDVLVFKVFSRDQLTLEEMLELDSGSPCMLLVLAQADTGERWVVRAIP